MWSAHIRLFAQLSIKLLQSCTLALFDAPKMGWELYGGSIHSDGAFKGLIGIQKTNKSYEVFKMIYKFLAGFYHI